ncbi:thioesterase II family protein [Amycolatopsis cihanbeyliensis]|uniref:Surfactin synthase thioesterase subunit n=1 Tax=Amycolatopsis cihanbeyliensis TaxID=1128664 RepID=A0A542DSA2_AMYCI|nr:thioesterase II family protein [Amycolatopsis cihanbeyliensis]TQJ05856.1 surfactin synthase thioesterase subunit [Amycolatopsis cihanbeyliensis]
MTVNAEDTTAWIRRYHPAPEAPHRLVCFPHAGGSASYYFPVARSLSPRVDVLAMQYPGRQDRYTEPCIDDIGELAERAAEVLRPWADQPLAFFGHSMGASLAFEVARKFEAEGIPLQHLFVSGRRAPTRTRDEGVHLLDDDGLLAEMRRLGGTEAAVLQEDDLVKMMLPVLRSDYKAAETYRYVPGPDVSCPIHALVGDADPRATVDEARSWGDHTSGEFTLRVFPGGHFYLGEQQAEVLRTISDHLG